MPFTINTFQYRIAAYAAFRSRLKNKVFTIPEYRRFYSGECELRSAKDAVARLVNLKIITPVDGGYVYDPRYGNPILDEVLRRNREHMNEKFAEQARINRKSYIDNN
jgi:hypothetical protein